jgi:hypothetical protein
MMTSQKWGFVKKQLAASIHPVPSPRSRVAGPGDAPMVHTRPEDPQFRPPKTNATLVGQILAQLQNDDGE